MELKACSLQKLSKPDRGLARLARMAQTDVYVGTARASWLASRCTDPVWNTIVSQAYTHPQGVAADFFGWQCPECGCAHLSEADARLCCTY